MSKFQKLFRIIGYAKPGKGLLLTIALLSVIGASTSLAFPMLTQQLVDSFSDATSIPTYWITIIGVALFLSTIASGINYYLIGTVANKMLVNLRSKVLKKSIFLPVKYFDDNNSAEPASRIVNDTEVINSLVAEHFEPFISGILTLVSSLIILWILDWQLTSVLFVTLTLSFLITIPVASKLTQLSKSIQKQEASFLSLITERFSQIRLIKSSNAESETLESSRKNLNSLFNLGQKAVKISAIMAPISGITIISTLIAILAFGASRVSEGAITMGTLIAFILYLFNIVFPIIQFTFFIAAFNKAAGAADRVEELLTEIEDSVDEQTFSSDIKTWNLEFKELEFSYSKDKALFHSFNLKIPEKQTVAFVGESGSGKSTLFSLLLRFYNPNNGDICINGQSISGISLSNWRDNLAYISQDTPILSGSIRSNLTLGIKEKPTDEKIYEAINLAQLQSLVDSLPERLDAQVGERGVKLSGGQKQRLAIARAILQNAPILLCDEATSSLDSATELKIQQAMSQLSKNRTTLIAAHRLSTVRDADLIVVMKSGKIIGQGTHHALYDSSEYYRELVDIQMAVSELNQDKNEDELEYAFT